MSNQLTLLVNIFNGTNYQIWADKMADYLSFQGLFPVVDGTSTKPTASSPPEAGELDAINKWNKEDSQAKGAIFL